MSDNQNFSPTQCFYREAGNGPGVVCIHCNGSSSSQWRPLMTRLGGQYTVLAPDTHGAGRGPAWPTERLLSLRDEVALIEPVFARAGRPFALVGHSYGGAVALMAALECPERVSALVLYEPALFALVDADTPPPNEADGIRITVSDATAALAAGNRNSAAEIFIDYWMGKGAWATKPEAQREAIEASVTNVAGWGNALFGESTPLTAFQSLQMPVLLMQGSDTTPSARAVSALLMQVFPRLETLTFDGLGHMGPITHPTLVDAAIEEFLSRHHLSDQPGQFAG